MAATEEKVLTPEIISFIAEWKDKPGNLIMVLHRVQQHFGYIPREAAFEVADLLEVPVAKIYGVITFYHLFKMKKPGDNVIAVCMGTACYLKGAEDLIHEVTELLDIDVGEVTPDGKFSMEAVRCIGCCGLAPVISMNGKIYGNMVAGDMAKVIAEYK